MRVVIADDSVLVRAGIVSILRGAGIDVVAEAENADDLLREVDRHLPDAAIVDIRMPPDYGDEGLRAAQEIRARHPGMGIVILSQHVDLGTATRVLAESPERLGYLLKDRVGDIRKFMDALRRVANGGTALDPEVVAQLMARNRAGDPLSTLTPREREVLAAMAEGRTNIGIAKELGISEGAAEKHISNIFGKLQLPESPSDHRRVLAVLAYLGS